MTEMTVEQNVAKADPEDRLTMGVWVEGQPMDVHGQGTPLPSWSGLRSRLAPNNEPEQGQSVGTGEGVLVGLIDSGIVAHPWLNGGYLSAPDDFEKSFDKTVRKSVRNQEPIALQLGHGTFEAGLILQQAPAAGVWVERVLNSEGDATANRVQEAACALARRGVHVINLSLGTFIDEKVYTQEAIQRIVDSVYSINEEYCHRGCGRQSQGEGRATPPLLAGRSAQARGRGRRGGRAHLGQTGLVEQWRRLARSRRTRDPSAQYLPQPEDIPAPRAKTPQVSRMGHLVRNFIRLRGRFWCDRFPRHARPGRSGGRQRCPGPAPAEPILRAPDRAG